MKKRHWIMSTIIVLGLLFVGLKYYAEQIANPRVIKEIINNPNGGRAALVALIDLPSGRSVPVNYLQQDNLVFIGVDGGWWREFASAPTQVQLLIRGESLTGSAVVVLDDPDYTNQVFLKLRPTAPKWLPAWLNGKLVVITLAETSLSTEYADKH
ncbi:MAG: hypothetical protein P8N51_17305 [Pseudomonadales bacterium]|nr:hypothetical protein [Pseudomonadales bacterium]MDG1444509.1 hypothetical protein [Pseudomonadales bacterium]